MRKIGYAIAYSQGARSVAVAELLAAGTLDAAFDDFDPRRLSRRTPVQVRRRHWDDIGAIRFKGKVDSILKAAEVLNGIVRDHGSFAAYLRTFGIPRRIRSLADVEAFWETCTTFQDNMRERDMPFFNKTTSLLQLLLDLDYDCIKPDLIVMRLARRIGLVEKEIGDRHFREAVWALQTYGVLRGIRPAAMDWYVLAFGGQTEAARSLKRRFCPGPGSCRRRDCPVGSHGLCADYSR